jgi:hypothetical protein
MIQTSECVAPEEAWDWSIIQNAQVQKLKVLTSRYDIYGFHYTSYEYIFT